MKKGLTNRNWFANRLGLISIYLIGLTIVALQLRSIAF